MSHETRTLYDQLFGNMETPFVYFIGKDGKPNYGFVVVGGIKYEIVKITIFDGQEILFLENGQTVNGRNFTR